MSCGRWFTCANTSADHLCASGLRCKLRTRVTVLSSTDHTMYSFESREKPRNKPSFHLLPNFPSSDKSLDFLGSLKRQRSAKAKSLVP